MVFMKFICICVRAESFDSCTGVLYTLEFLNGTCKILLNLNIDTKYSYPQISADQLKFKISLKRCFIQKGTNNTNCLIFQYMFSNYLVFQVIRNSYL